VKLQRQIDDLQAQRASEWFEILRDGRPEDMSGFREWCSQSPLHIREFLEITWADRALDNLDPERAEDLDSLLREISANVRPWPARPDADAKRSESSEIRGPRARRWGLAAAVAILAVGLVFYKTQWRSVQEFSTKIGEQRTVELVDTSVITLNTNSDIQVQFESSVRNIELRHGEAVFKVAHDPSRPFRVHTRAGTVQAVGTQFNVYDRPDGTDVAVLEGRVRLMPRVTDKSAAAPPEDLVAGEEARIGLDGQIRRVEHADVAGAVAWSKRRIKFDNAPLEDMVREFNRYHRNLHLRLEGVPPGSHHYSGIFDADDPGMLATILEHETDLTVERFDGEIVIRSRDPSGRIVTDK
jgi:transmembrane sensor